MTEIEIIRAEIEKRLIESIENEWLTEIAEYESLLSFIDSIQVNPCEGCTNRKGCVTCENGELRETEQEEPVSEELEAEIQQYVEQKKLPDVGFLVPEIARHFANWQKQQMMKYAVNCIYYGRNTYGLHIETTAFRNLGLHYGDEVKLIIIKK